MVKGNYSIFIYLLTGHAGRKSFSLKGMEFQRCLGCAGYG